MTVPCQLRTSAEEQGIGVELRTLGFYVKTSLGGETYTVSVEGLGEILEFDGSARLLFKDAMAE